ncbi:hypothetical protein [Georgenia sp. SYP-B2076]|uniref:hypothetical protein n=1 Tax=Georgenia sp. SYP-B2076 TaxID=2495881 RepID=UPI000F8DE69E|nr:hypothetical protein [Georgenia sp. SYP-B2076]
MISDEQRGDEALDRLVAGAYFFRAVTHEQWVEFVAARAGFYALPEVRRGAERERFVARLPFVQELIERDRAQA